MLVSFILSSEKTGLLRLTNGSRFSSIELPRHCVCIGFYRTDFAGITYIFC